MPADAGEIIGICYGKDYATCWKGLQELQPVEKLVKSARKTIGTDLIFRPWPGPLAHELTFCQVEDLLLLEL